MLCDYVRYDYVILLCDYVRYDYVIMRFFVSSSIMGGSNTVCKKYFLLLLVLPPTSNQKTLPHQRSSDKRFIPTRHKNKLLFALTKRGGNNIRPWYFDMCFICALKHKWDVWLRRVWWWVLFWLYGRGGKYFLQTVLEPPIILLLLF